MKAISLWQPWGQLIVIREKLIETRGYPTNIRGRIAIHATKSDHSNILLNIPPQELEYFKKAGVMEVNKPPRGVIIGTVVIVDSKPIEDLYGTNYDTPKERAFGDWSQGRWGWILKEPVLFDKPIPARGYQGFWNWETEDDWDYRNDSYADEEFKCCNNCEFFIPDNGFLIGQCKKIGVDVDKYNICKKWKLRN